MKNIILTFEPFNLKSENLFYSQKYNIPRPHPGKFAPLKKRCFLSTPAAVLFVFQWESRMQASMTSEQLVDQQLT